MRGSGAHLTSVLYGLGQRHVFGHVGGVAHRFPDHPNQNPSPGTILVEACGVDEAVEPSLDTVANVAGEVLPAIPQHRCELVVRIAVQRLGCDREPRLTVSGEHGSVVKVAVQDGVVRAVGEFSGQGVRLLDQSVRNGCAARQRFEVGTPLRDLRSERTQLGHCRNVEATIQACDYLAGVDVRHRFQRFRAQSLQQQRATRRIGAQQPGRAVPRPSPQDQVRMFRVGRADLQHGPRAVGGAHRQDAAQLFPVGAELPLIEVKVEVAQANRR